MQVSFGDFNVLFSFIQSHVFHTTAGNMYIEKAHRFIEWGIGIDFYLPDWKDLVDGIDFTDKKVE